MFAKLPKIDFQKLLFDDAIQYYGINAVWKRAMMCYCFSRNGQPDPNCPDCYGEGTLYVDPTDIRVLAYGFTSDNLYEEIGMRTIGTCTITVKSTDFVGYKDKLVFPDFLASYSEFIDTSINPTSKTRYPVESIIALYTSNGRLDVDVNFRVDEGKMNILWDLDTPEPTRYSLLYMIKPVYIVADVLKELRGSFVKDGVPTEEFTLLPRQFLIKKDDFGRRVEVP